MIILITKIVLIGISLWCFVHFVKEIMDSYTLSKKISESMCKILNWDKLIYLFLVIILTFGIGISL